MDLLSDFPVVIELPVQWGDQDAFGHVNNTVYIRWFESGRIAYLDKIGVDSTHDGRHVGPILASITCHFRMPVNYPDSVRIGTRITRIGHTSMTVAHRVINQARQVVAEGDSVVVVYDYEAAKPHPVGDDLRKLIERLEGRPL